MENFKLDLSKLTPVAEKDRVKGNWYVVADDKEGFKAPGITQYHSSNRGMDLNGEQSWAEWKHWFAIPPNLPGFPVAELPDEFELNVKDWQYKTDTMYDWLNLEKATFDGERIIKHRRKPNLPELTIPEQTASERKKWLQRELEKLG